jgi:prepilin-type N-terminal cleavage/methylation domain-containing protein
MKKAFNIVELSIVLVIIGILMAMVIKGKDLLNAAELRAEIRKIERIRDVTVSLVAQKSGNLNYIKSDANGKVDIDQYFVSELLNAGDLRVADTTDWGIYFCRFAGDHYENNSTASNLCAINAYYYLDLICNAEIVLDDQSTTTGLGLAKGSSFSENIFGTSGKYNCDSVTRLGNSDNASGLPSYGFLIFK